MERGFLRRMVVVIGAISLIVQAGGAAQAATSPQPTATYKESFEQDMGGWQPVSDGLARAWRVYRTTEQASDGEFGVGFETDGRDDDGTVWIQRAFRAQPNTTVTVSLSFSLHSRSAGAVNGWNVVGFAGTRTPRSEEDFSVIGKTDRAGGWAPYTFRTRVTTDGSGTVWVAAGVSVLWETIRTYYVDLVETTIAA